MIGIVGTVALAAALRGPGQGSGQAGENIDASFKTIVAGVWLTLFVASAVALWIFGIPARAQSADAAQPEKPAAKFILVAKLAALGALLIAAPSAWWPQLIYEIDFLIWFRKWSDIGFYIVAYAFALIALAVVPFLRSWKLRIPILTFILAGFALDQCLLVLSGQPLTKGMIEIGIRERNLAAGFFQAYGGKLFLVLALTALVGVPLGLPPARRWRISSVNAFYPVAALALAVGLCWHSTRELALPSPFAVPARLSVALSEPSLDDAVRRDPVKYSGPFKPRAKKIVMVVDESVRGDYLGLNNPAFDNTPSLSASDRLSNFGIALSSTNCSAPSRMILRTGLQPSQLPDTAGIWRKVPTIWQYAAAANYKTVFLDAWFAYGTFHSHMNTEESRQIGQFLTVLDLPRYKRDNNVADRLIELLKQDEPMLIYVNKYGTHLPYDQAFAPSFSYHPPESVIASLPYGENQRQLVSDYHRALRWSVEGFFRKVLPAIDADTVLIYTSDHGEAWYEGGSAFGHCNVKPAPNEAYVPLFVATASAPLRASFDAVAATAYNRASHFHIFPTLLELMGFDEHWVKDKIGPSLLHFEGHPAKMMRSFQEPWFDVAPPPLKDSQKRSPPTN